MKKNLLTGFCLVALLGGFAPRQSPSHYIQTGSVEELYDFFRRTPDRVPLISAHRGGPAPRFPENCIPYVPAHAGQGYALIEFDVHASKDDSLVVMHDDRLDRTTNGTGPVKDHTYGQLRKLRLEDNEGTLTPYGIPTLSEVLWWAKGKTILTLDPKRGVSPERIVAAIREAEAEAYTVVITYTADQAARYHQLHPGLVLSVSVKQPADLRRLDSLGVPADRMLAFVGVSEPDSSLYGCCTKKAFTRRWARWATSTRWPKPGARSVPGVDRTRRRRALHGPARGSGAGLRSAVAPPEQQGAVLPGVRRVRQ
jgi:glycerophosphoryl diester phosphodiesterase